MDGSNSRQGIGASDAVTASNVLLELRGWLRRRRVKGSTTLS